jgi:hypothetical protein
MVQADSLVCERGTTGEPADRASELLRDMPACPACGEATAVEESPVRAEKRYAEALAGLGVPVSEIHVWRCLGCGSLWRRPWVADAPLHDLYSRVLPSHPGGWHFGRIGGAVPGGGRRLDRFIRKHVGEFDSYGEFGCPNWGLLAYYGAQRFRLLGGSADVGGDAIVLGAACGDLAEASTLRARALRALLGFRRAPVPRRLVHIAAAPELFWSAGCARDGVACRERLRVQAARAELHTIDAPPHEPLDILAALNVVDHHPEPAELLRRLGTFARHLFVFTHGLRHGWRAVQHAVNFSPSGITALAARSGWSVVAPYRVRDEKTDYGMLFRRTR